MRKWGTVPSPQIGTTLVNGLCFASGSNTLTLSHWGYITHCTSSRHTYSNGEQDRALTFPPHKCTSSDICDQDKLTPKCFILFTPSFNHSDMLNDAKQAITGLKQYKEVVQIQKAISSPQRKSNNSSSSSSSDQVKVPFVHT